MTLQRLMLDNVHPPVVGNNEASRNGAKQLPCSGDSVMLDILETWIEYWTGAPDAVYPNSLELMIRLAFIVSYVR